MKQRHVAMWSSGEMEGAGEKGNEAKQSEEEKCSEARQSAVEKCCDVVKWSEVGCSREM